MHAAHDPPPPVGQETVGIGERNGRRAEGDFNHAGTNGAFLPRVAAVLMLNPNLQLDQRYPVAIRIGDFSSIFPSPQTVGTSNLISYVVPAVLAAKFIPPPADPHTLVFRRKSQDPTHKGELLLPIVVYRQQVTNAAFPRVSGVLTQVTPLLERIPYSAAACPNCQPSGTWSRVAGGRARHG